MAVESEDLEDVTDTSLVTVSENRARVLEALHRERRTVSELARILDLNKSTVHGYLRDLVQDGLVRRHEDGDRLWVYYDLSETGTRLVDRGRLRLVVDLSSDPGRAGECPGAAEGSVAWVYTTPSSREGDPTRSTSRGAGPACDQTDVDVGDP